MKRSEVFPLCIRLVCGALSAIPACAYAGDAPMPSLEMLEYLGSMVEHEGAWVDPLSLDEEDHGQEVTAMGTETKEVPDSSRQEAEQ
ncbi:MAG: hypothetical protein QF515_18870 [Pseudomonadales bacterium]|nr:hypothetical protein [Pseudomonadales bacterium]MDP6469986.1 hypothetical protein [Pseudomonadales bacterium]MDP6829154.1 hypothetical protein [Pseudomonadales bacterium]